MLDSSIADLRVSLKSLIENLFPIHRTLVNEGYNKSLEIIQNEIPINALKYPSGQKVFDWVIPKSWNVREAYIMDSQNNKILNFGDNNLHLSAYSMPFQGLISHEDLIEHLNYREDLPDAIPYNFHYYKDYWSFNVSYNDFKEKFKSKEYFIKIDIDCYDDNLLIGEYVLKGYSDEEILITSYLCHPSMVNDNLSGVVAAVEMFKYISSLPNRRYTYRLLVMPETIGSITYLANLPANDLSKIKSGLTVYCCADNGKLHYKKTYTGNSYTDKVFDYMLNSLFKEENHKLLDFWPGGSDERQFNSPGIRLPIGGVTRTPAAEFKSYHTSLDNLETYSINGLIDTVEKLIAYVDVLEADITYKNCYKGEPCFSKHPNIKYPTFQDALSKSSTYITKILASEVDGNNSILDIAIKWNINVFSLLLLAKSFEEAGLIKK